MTSSEYFVEPFVDTGLGNSAYLVGSHATHTAVLIDGLRDVDRYRYAAERHSVQITHVVDTHLHADFVSGARELAAQVGAVIGASAAAQLGFAHQPLAEGDALPLGDHKLRVMTTPGHTPEHISFLLTPSATNSTPEALFSGGALIVGGTARTDLLGHEHAVPLAHQLYHTLHHKLLTLPDSVVVYPTHGAGSFCAAPTSDKRTTTIGDERQNNRLARVAQEEDFVIAALSGLPSYPVYYGYMRTVNQQGAKLFGGLPMLKPLAAEEAHGHVESGVLVLDVRPKEAFIEAHIPGAYGIQLDAPLITWAGWLIPFGAPLLLLAANAADREEAVRQLMRIGYDNLVGYLAEGMDGWARAGLRTASLPTISAKKLQERRHQGEPLIILDVRQDSEWRAGHIPGALHIENGRLPWDALPLPQDPATPIVVHCARGVRSTAGISVLKRRGYTNLIQMTGGFEAWRQAGFEVES